MFICLKNTCTILLFIQFNSYNCCRVFSSLFEAKRLYCGGLSHLRLILHLRVWSKLCKPLRVCHHFASFFYAFAGLAKSKARCPASLVSWTDERSGWYLTKLDSIIALEAFLLVMFWKARMIFSIVISVLLACKMQIRLACMRVRCRSSTFRASTSRALRLSGRREETTSSTMLEEVC
jgi:hypothetical protein